MRWSTPGQTVLLPDPIEDQFREFHHDNPHVYRELVVLAREWRATGKSWVSIKMLWEILRHRIGLRTAGEEQFTLNNNYTALYARLIMANEPDLDGFFRTRRRRRV